MIAFSIMFPSWYLKNNKQWLELIS
jgi:hypothetical protein